MEITFINKTNQDMHAYEEFFQTIAKRTEKELKLAKDFRNLVLRLFALVPFISLTVIIVG